MRRLAIILALLLIPLTAYAVVIVVQSASVGGGGGGGGSCATIADQATDVGTGSSIWAYGYGYSATQFTAGSSYTLCKVDVVLKKTGTPDYGVITAKIYSDSTNTPNSLLATSTNTVASSSTGTTNTTITFNFSGLSITSSSKYHISLSVPSPSGAGSGFEWMGTPDAGSYWSIATDGTDWMTNDNVKQSFTTYKE